MDIQSRLMARLKELDGRLHEVETELDKPRSQDWEEQATEREDDEVLERLGLAGQQEIAGIRAALERLRTGEYGFCTACGGEISSKRLDILPATPFCKTCVH